ncbi:MAG: HEAT repeat domain-containing protein [Methanoregulaceae archaeon]
MDLSLEKPAGEWFNALPKTEYVYRLIDATQVETEQGQRLLAIDSLGKSDDPRAVRPLMDLEEDSNAEIRMAATIGLGRLRSGRSVEVLIRRLKDAGEDTEIRRNAAIALASIRSIGAIRGLQDFIGDEREDPSLRASAREALDRNGNW